MIMAIHKNQFNRILQGGEVSLQYGTTYSFVNNEENFDLFYDTDTHEFKEISNTKISDGQINKIIKRIFDFKKDYVDEDDFEMSHEEQYNAFY